MGIVVNILCLRINSEHEYVVIGGQDGAGDAVIGVARVSKRC